MTTLSVRHDLRGRFGPARDQQGRETCLAFALSDAHAAAIGGAWMPLSCEYLFYHAKQRDQTAAHHGTTIPAIREALEQDGQPVESAWAYLSQLPADVTQWRPPTNVGTLFRRQSDVNGMAFDDIWATVESGQPVLVGMTVSDAFYAPGADGIVDSDEPEDPMRKHAVVIVATATQAKKRLVLARNSWGQAWGMSGYAWLVERYASPRIRVVLAIQ